MNKGIHCILECCWVDFLEFLDKLNTYQNLDQSILDMYNDKLLKYENFLKRKDFSIPKQSSETESSYNPRLHEQSPVLHKKPTLYETFVNVLVLFSQDLQSFLSGPTQVWQL